MHRILLSRLLPAGILLSILTPLLLSARTHVWLEPDAACYVQGKEVLVKARLEELLMLCRARDYVQSASYLVYRGPQKKREWKDIFNYNNADEQPRVESICNRIHDLMDSWDGHEVGDVKVEKESEGEWVALEVTFTKGASTRKTTFAFLKVKGKYCLGDMD